ncbi:MAG: hypothetical protein ACD_61C00286G0009 [uncultured bacterium]|nr:MAG: hypothetical protein ACD_61C00286G0009 [uncultured bacterium]
MARFIIIDRREINSKILDAIKQIDPSLRLGDSSGNYDPSYKDPEDFLDRSGFSIIEPKQPDNRPRTKLFHIPVGKLPKSFVLAFMELNVDDKKPYSVSITSYGAAGRTLAEGLACRLLPKDISVTIYVQHFKIPATILS